MIVAIQILRGVAALLVAISHLPWGAYRASVSPHFPDLSICFFGVDLFFVVSGFVMVHATAGARGNVGPGGFLLRRFIRVVPLYWIFTSLTFAMAMRGASLLDLSRQEWGLVAGSYLLVPYRMSADAMDFFPMLPQGWTLEYELFFYLCFAAALWLCPRRVVAAVSTGFVALCALGAVATLPTPLLQYARTNTLEFVYGMVLARLVLAGVRMPGWLAALLIGAGAAAALLFAPRADAWDALRGFGWGLPAAAIVGGAVLASPWRRGVATWPLEVLGDASYSLYLVHDFVYDAIRHVVTGTDDALVPISLRLWPAMLGAAILAAVASYRFVERPMTRALQRRLLRRVPLVPAPLPALHEPEAGSAKP